MPSRKVFTRALFGVCLLLVVFSYAAGESWGLRAAVGLFMATLIVRWGLASIRPLSVGAKTYEPVDVVEPEGVPVYSCKECGTQLVLLRKGSDKPPRHCGEAMAYAVVPEQPVPYYPPDFPPDDV